MTPSIVFPPGTRSKTRFVVGVSGGADSISLLKILVDARPGSTGNLVAAHVNYGLRGRDSDRDEERVRELCREWRVPFRMLRVTEFKRKVRTGKRSLQDLAREIRYSFFQKSVALEKAWGVAVAHHLEDQAETVLDRLLRGAGSRGLSGLRTLQVLALGDRTAPLKVWRPLLAYSKRDLRSYLVTLRIPWREDRSNLGIRYRRNQIRREIIPYLSRWNPRLIEVLSRIGEVAAADDRFMEGLLPDVAKRIGSRKTKNRMVCRADLFGKIHRALQRRWIRAAAERLSVGARGLSFDRIEEVIALWAGLENGPRDLGHGLIAGREGNSAYLHLKGRKFTR